MTISSIAGRPGTWPTPRFWGRLFPSNIIAPRVLIAPNAFKGSLTASQAASAIEKGVLRALPGASCLRLAIADGGDGLLEVLVGALGGRKIRETVTGPLGARVRAPYGLLPGGIAVVEMALASGLGLVREKNRRPLEATSRGTGELIRAALRRGAREVWIGLGGSASNDGGAGMARALGIRFLDRFGKNLPEGVGALSRLDRIVASGLLPLARRARFVALSDVTNPLLGPRGSARVFAPQKGATPAQVRRIEKSLGRYARRLRRDLGQDVAGQSGAGAAGGLGAGLIAFLGAEVRPGARFVLEVVQAERETRRADLVVTGEGRLDRSSFYGKAPIELARLSRRLGVPVLLLCGCVEPGLGARLRRLGARALSLGGPGLPRERLMSEAGPLLTRLAERACATG